MSDVTRRARGAWAFAGVLLAVVLVLAGCGGDASRPAPADPVGTWRASPVATGDVLADQTMRMAVRTSIGGSGLVVRLSNAFGDRPVVVDDLTVARRAGAGADAVPGSVAPVTVAGRRSVTLAPGAAVASDPVDVAVDARAELLVSLHVAGTTGPLTGHVVGLDPSWVAAPGPSHAGDEGASAFAPAAPSRSLLTGLDVTRPTSDAGAVVAFGDSITDGVGSSTDASARWPDRLADRLIAGGQPMAVVDAGIGGNRLLSTAPSPGTGPSGLDRFATDALAVPGVRTVVVLEGINDLSGGAGAAPVVDGLRRLVAAAHGRGVCAVLGTLTPFNSASPTLEAARQEINAAIRGGRTGADAVADFDVALRDPDVPTRLEPDLDSGDGLHPSDAGYAAMAAAVDPRSLACAR